MCKAKKKHTTACCDGGDSGDVLHTVVKAVHTEQVIKDTATDSYVNKRIINVVCAAILIRLPVTLNDTLPAPCDQTSGVLGGIC